MPDRESDTVAVYGNLLVNPQDRRNADFERRIKELEDKLSKLSVAFDELGRRQDADYQHLKGQIAEQQGD